jgi:hypothetical protein
VLERAEAIDALEAAYRAAGVARYAVWVHEHGADLRAALSARGYAVAESTRAMGRSLAGLAPGAPDVDLAAPDWREHLLIIDVADDLLGDAGAAPPGVHVLVVRDGLATAHALDHDGDCGTFNVVTVQAARREPAVGPDGRGRLRDRRLPRPQADPRIRPCDALAFAPVRREAWSASAGPCPRSPTTPP